eukprot:gene3955-6418_t
MEHLDTQQQHRVTSAISRIAAALSVNSSDNFSLDDIVVAAERHVHETICHNTLNVNDKYCDCREHQQTSSPKILQQSENHEHGEHACLPLHNTTKDSQKTNSNESNESKTNTSSVQNASREGIEKIPVSAGASSPGQTKGPDKNDEELFSFQNQRLSSPNRTTKNSCCILS